MGVALDCESGADWPMCDNILVCHNKALYEGFCSENVTYFLIGLQKIKGQQSIECLNRLFHISIFLIISALNKTFSAEFVIVFLIFTMDLNDIL